MILKGGLRVTLKRGLRVILKGGLRVILKEGTTKFMISEKYMDDLGKTINNINARCIIGAALINHLMYADNLVLDLGSLVHGFINVAVCLFGLCLFMV